MGRPVKCRICGKTLNKDLAYRAVTIGPKSGKEVIKYCCSEQEWQAEENRKKKFQEDKDRVYYLICDIFGYEIQNTRLFDEWAKWNKLKSNEVIYQYIRENEDYLRKICDKQYDDENGRIRYFSAILKNSLYDFKPKVVNEEKKVQPKVVIEEVIYEAPARSLNKRRSLADLEDEL